MDSRLFHALVSNSMPAFVSLVQENQEILKERTAGEGSTPLHLASRFGHVELVKEIVDLCPEMVAAVNKKLETPLHEACRKGTQQVFSLLFETNPLAISQLNNKNQTALFIACSIGHLDIVNHILNQPWTADLEEEADAVTFLHIAASKGYIEVVTKILEVSPSFSLKTNNDGSSPLHCSCSRGHFEISSMLLRLEPDVAVQFNNSGYTPLHLAAISGHVAILEEFLSVDPTSFHCFTKGGETVFHLTVRFHQFDALKYLARIFKDTTLFDQPDHYGNTILHLAVNLGHHDLAVYIIKETKVDVEYQNNDGNTALDVLGNLDQLGSTLENLHLEDMLKKAGGKSNKSLNAKVNHSHELFEIKRSDYYDKHVELPNEPVTQAEKDESIKRDTNNQDKSMRISNLQAVPRDEENNETPDNNQSEMRKADETQANLDRHKQLSKRHRNELINLYRSHSEDQHKMNQESLENARNTIILVAILIATVTFAAGINPPGGVHQEGPLKGKSAVGRTTAFKVFLISNNAALFISLCMVFVLVSIITFERKPLISLLGLVHKLMGLAVSFLVTAYVAALWVIVPHGQGTTEWTIQAAISIAAGTIGFVFIVLGVMSVKHWLGKKKWKEEQAKKNEASKTNETNNTVAEVQENRSPSAKFLNQLSVNSDVRSASSGYYPLPVSCWDYFCF